MSDFTFNPSPFPALDNGNDLMLRVPFKNFANGKAVLGTNFVQLITNIVDVEDPARSTSVALNLFDMEYFLNEARNSDATHFTLNILGGRNRNLLVSIYESRSAEGLADTANLEQALITGNNGVLPIVLASNPARPSLKLQTPPTITANANGQSLTMSNAVIRVNFPTNVGNSTLLNARVFVVSKNHSGVSSQSASVTLQISQTDLMNKYIDITMTTPTTDIARDSDVYFYGSVDNIRGESEISEKLSFNVSVKVSIAPQILSALSFEDGKSQVTISFWAYNKNKNHHMTVYAKATSSLDNTDVLVNVIPTNINFMLDDVLPAGEVLTDAPKHFAVTKTLTTIGGNPLSAYTAYRLVAVIHANQVTNTNLADLRQTSLPLTSSPTSNTDKTLVAVRKLRTADNVSVTSTSAYNVSIKELTVSSALNDPSSLLNNSSYFRYSLRAKSSGVVVDSENNAQGDRLLRNMIAKIPNDEKFEVVVLIFILMSPELLAFVANLDEYLTIGLDGNRYYQMGTVTGNETFKPIESNLVPLPKNFRLGTAKVGATNRLTTSFETPKDALPSGYKYHSASFQFVEGIEPNFSVPAKLLTNSAGDSTHVVNAVAGDLNEDNVVDLPNVNPIDGNYFSARARLAIVNGASVVHSEWVNVPNYRAPLLLSSAPSNLAVSNANPSKNPATQLKLAVGCLSPANLTGLPVHWTTSATQKIAPVSVHYSIKNSWGVTIEEYEHLLKESEVNDYLEGSQAKTFELFSKPSSLVLQGGEKVYTKAALSYALFNKESGAWKSVQSSVKGSETAAAAEHTAVEGIVIEYVSLAQTPAATAPGVRNVDNNGMTSLKVSAKIKMNGNNIADTTVRALIQHKIGNQQVGYQQVYDAPMTYYASTDLWHTSSLYPSANVDYNSCSLGVIADHPSGTKIKLA